MREVRANADRAIELQTQSAKLAEESRVADARDVELTCRSRGSKSPRLHVGRVRVRRHRAARLRDETKRRRAVINPVALSALPLARVAGDLLATPGYARTPSLPDAHAELESAERWREDALFTGAAIGAVAIVGLLVSRR
jgi:hypothetical protein